MGKGQTKKVKERLLPILCTSASRCEYQRSLFLIIMKKDEIVECAKK